MKKFILTALLSLVALGASAQIEPGFRIGAQLMGGINTLVGHQYSDGFIKPVFSYGIGFDADYNFSENFYLATALSFQDKSWTTKNVSDIFHAYYLTLPIYVGGRIPIGYSYLFLQAGPQLGFAIAGSSIIMNNGRELAHSEWGSVFEFGVGAKIGAEFSQFQVFLALNYGVTNAFKIDFDKANNLDVCLGLAYMF